MPPSNLNAQVHSLPPLNRPVHFVSGPYANRTVRAELDELQKADVGRKCGNRDRRPLDPPPVVRLRLFEVLNEGTPQEAEKEITDINEAVSYGFLCFVDLFPWPPPPPAIEPGLQCEQPSFSVLQTRDQIPVPRSEVQIPPSLASIMTQWAPRPGPRTLLYSAADSHSAPAGPSRSSVQQSGHPQGSSCKDNSFVETCNLPPLHAFSPAPRVEHQRSSAEHIAAVVNGVPIKERASCTQAFVGATFVTASCFSHDGRPSLLFVFSDLACNMDGTFLLRYRAMNCFSGALESDRLPVLAECWGGPVTVYPTKDFPGLAESTELTKYLSRFGVPVHIRQGERKKRARRDQYAAGDESSHAAP